MLKITKGKYKLNNSLSVVIYKTIEFKEGNIYYLHGENGSGKTSFIKHLLIPRLLKYQMNKFYIFYASQDFTIQFYVIKAYYKGLKDEKVKLSSVEETLLFIEKIYRKLDAPIYYILDEIDQYTKLLPFIEKIKQREKHSEDVIIFTSHNIDTQKKYIEVFFKRKTENITEIQHYG